MKRTWRIVGQAWGHAAYWTGRDWHTDKDAAKTWKTERGAVLALKRVRKHFSPHMRPALEVSA